MKKLLVIISTLCLFCTSKKEENVVNKSIPVITPKPIFESNYVDTTYFRFIGSSTAVLEDGSVMIPDRTIPALLIIDSEGNLKKIHQGGRGPGEVEDIMDLTLDQNHNIFAYDQTNHKIMKFDKNGEFTSEFVKPATKTHLNKVYSISEDSLIFNSSFLGYLGNPELLPELSLTHYNISEESFGKSISLKDRVYARSVMDGRVVGGAQVAYGNSNLVYFDPDRAHIFSFDTETDVIAELNADFDTLRAIPVDLPHERITNALKDSIRVVYKKRPEQWKAMEPLLPEYKAVASNMLVKGEHIWLQTNLGYDYEEEKWLVLDMNGTILAQVNLPDESMITHVSEHHIGVRLDSYTFALYQSIEF